MLKDISNQKKIDKEVVLAAIQAVKAKGWDVNPYTVADEAKIPKTALYRSSELMSLLEQERGSPIAPMTSGSDELLHRCEELEHTVEALQKQVSHLPQAREEAWQLGYQAGYQAGKEDGTAGIESVGEQTGDSFDAVPSIDLQPGLVTQSSDPHADTGDSYDAVPAQEISEPVHQNKQQTDTYAPQPFFPETSSQDAMVSKDSGMVNAPIGGFASADQGIFNAASSGPFTTSDYNPLGDLSWSDLETVYNFRAANLKDLSREVDQVPPAEGPHYGYGAGLDEKAQALGEGGEAKAPGWEYFDNKPQNAWQAPSANVQTATGDVPVVPVVDLDNMDIFDDVDDLEALQSIEVISDVHHGLEGAIADKDIPRDELRALLEHRKFNEGKADADDGDPSKASARNKFVGGKAPHEPPPPPTPIAAKPKALVRNISPEIRKACLILGVRPEEITTASVIDAWKRQIAAPGVHPDLGGDTESAVYLNTAKDTLVRWLDDQAPKLGKKFKPGNQ